MDGSRGESSLLNDVPRYQFITRVIIRDTHAHAEVEERRGRREDGEREREMEQRKGISGCADRLCIRNHLIGHSASFVKRID